MKAVLHTVKGYMETRLRSVLKSIVWRIIATLNGFLVTYYFTGNVSASLTISVVANATGLVLYYFHERAWNLTKFGIEDLHL